MKNPLQLLIAGLLCLGMPLPTEAAVTLFSDDFSDLTSGSVSLSTRSAAFGSWTSVSGGALITGNASGGFVETQGGAKVIDANFTRALGSGDVLRVIWDTQESLGSFVSGVAGIQLFLADGSGVGFFGSSAAVTSSWELAKAVDSTGTGNISATSVLASQGNEAGVATFSYSYDTGLAWLTVKGGVGGADIRTATLDLGVGLAIDSLRVGNSGGGDLRFTALKATGASDGMWKADAAGSWSNGALWSNDLVPNAAGAVADFSNVNISANRMVSLDGSKTIGHLILGDLDTVSGAVWDVGQGSGGTLTLDNQGSSPILQVNNSASNITAQLVGTHGFTKTGNGSITLNNTANASTLSGQIVVNQGYLGINHDLALGAVPTIFNPSALVLNGGVLTNMTESRTGVSTQYSAGHQVTINANRGITLGSNGGRFRSGYFGTNMFLAVESVITGVGSLTKDDSANLIFRGANTYQGNTIITSGAFYANNTAGSAIGSGGLSVIGNDVTLAMIAGTGALRGSAGKTFNVSTFATLRVGNSHNGSVHGGGIALDSTAQDLVFGNVDTPENLTINLLGTLQFDLFGQTADQLVLRTTGLIDLGIKSLGIGVIHTTGWSLDQEWKLIDWGTASYINEGTLDAFSMLHQGFQLDGDVRNDGFYLVVVPEPSRALLLMAGFAWIWSRRRIRR